MNPPCSLFSPFKDFCPIFCHIAKPLPLPQHSLFSPPMFLHPCPPPLQYLFYIFQRLPVPFSPTFLHPYPSPCTLSFFAPSNDFLSHFLPCTYTPVPHILFFYTSQRLPAPFTPKFYTLFLHTLFSTFQRLPASFDFMFLHPYPHPHSFFAPSKVFLSHSLPCSYMYTPALPPTFSFLIYTFFSQVSSK